MSHCTQGCWILRLPLILPGSHYGSGGDWSGVLTSSLSPVTSKQTPNSYPSHFRNCSQMDLTSWSPATIKPSFPWTVAILRILHLRVFPLQSTLHSSFLLKTHTRPLPDLCSSGGPQSLEEQSRSLQSSSLISALSDLNHPLPCLLPPWHGLPSLYT